MGSSGRVPLVLRQSLFAEPDLTATLEDMVRNEADNDPAFGQNTWCLAHLSLHRQSLADSRMGGIVVYPHYIIF